MIKLNRIASPALQIVRLPRRLAGSCLSARWALGRTSTAHNSSRSSASEFLQHFIEGNGLLVKDEALAQGYVRLVVLGYDEGPLWGNAEIAYASP